MNGENNGEKALRVVTGGIAAENVVDVTFHVDGSRNRVGKFVKGSEAAGESGIEEVENLGERF